MKNRLFIGIPIPDEIKVNIINLIKLPENFKMAKKDNLHITVLFIGEVDISKNEIMRDTLKNALINHKSFNLEISKFGQFPETGYPKIIYLTGLKGQNNLKALADSIRESFRSINIIDNKNFEYHITIARQKFKNNKSIKLPELKESYYFNADKVIIYKSILKPDGPEYIELYCNKIN